MTGQNRKNLEEEIEDNNRIEREVTRDYGCKNSDYMIQFEEVKQDDDTSSKVYAGE